MADGHRTELEAAYASYAVDEARRNRDAAARKLKRIERMVEYFDRQKVNPRLKIADRHEMIMLAKSYRNSLPRLRSEVESAEKALEDAERGLAEVEGREDRRC